ECELYKKLSVNQHAKIHLNNFLKNKNINKPKTLSKEKSTRLFFEYCEKYNILPTAKTTYKKHKIGEWYHGQKKTMNDNNCDSYKNLSVNQIVKTDLDNYLKNKNKKKATKKLNNEEKKTLLFEYCEKYKTVPAVRTKYKEFNLGIRF